MSKFNKCFLVLVLILYGLFFYLEKAHAGPGFNTIFPAPGIQVNTGTSPTMTQATATNVAAAYTGASGCSGAAALLFNATCSLFPTIHGTITPGDCANWFSTTSLGDAGAACGSGGGGCTGANPTAVIGLTAVNGVSSTNCIRSDGAPALSQAITPTWTGAHIHSPTTGVGITINAPATGGPDALVITGSTMGSESATINGGLGVAASLAFVDGQAAHTAFLVTDGATAGVFGIKHVGGIMAYQLNGTTGVQTLTGLSGQIAEIVIGGGATSADGIISARNSSAAVEFLVTGDGAVKMANLASSSSATTGTVCWTTGGNLTVDTTVACLASAGRFKQDVHPIDVGLDEVLKLRPVHYFLKPEFNPEHLGEQVGLIAEDVQKVDPRLVGLAPDGQVLGVRYMQLTALLAKGEQDLQDEIFDLKLAIAGLIFWNTWLTWGRRRAR